MRLPLDDRCLSVPDGFQAIILRVLLAISGEAAMDNYSLKDIQEFFWSLGPAAVGIFLIWFAQTKVAPNRAAGGRQMQMISSGAYGGCWLLGIVMLCGFVWIWVSPYLPQGRLFEGALEDLPNDMSVSTSDGDTAKVFYVSETTTRKSSLRTFKFVIRDSERKVERQTLGLVFSSKDNEFYARVDLRQIGKAALMSGFNLSFQERKQDNGEKAYLLRYMDGPPEAKFDLVVSQPAGLRAANDRPADTRFAARSGNNNWFANLFAAYAQSAPSAAWTRSSIVTGLASGAARVRDAAIAELADKLLTSADYRAIAEAIVSRKEDGATIRSRWSVYEAIRTAFEAARDTPVRNGVLVPPVPAALPLSDAALNQVFIDALAGTASANTAAKWLFRDSADPRTLELLFRKIGQASDAETKACYAAFAANLSYQWSVGVFLPVKVTGRQWTVSDGDLKTIESLYARVAALEAFAAATPETVSQFHAADFGLALLYAELSLLPPDKFKGARVESAEEKARWAPRAKELMAKFAAELPPGSKLLELYRYPFHRDIAVAVTSSGISVAALNPPPPLKVNANVRDNFCKEDAS